MHIHTTITDIRVTWFTSVLGDIIAIGIIGAAVTAGTFGTTAFTGGKANIRLTQ